MKTTLVAAAFAAGAIGVVTAFAGSATPDGTDFVVSADSGETYTYSTAIGNYSRLVKRDAGEVELTVAANGFAGSVVVEEGTLTIKDVNAVGTKTPVTVNNGATLYLKLSGGSKFAGHNLTIVGAGVGGNGAFRYSATSSGNSDYLIDKLILSGDATINCANRWGVNDGEGVVLNGHTLTSIGAGKWMVYDTIGGGGTLVCTKEQLTFQNNPVVDADTTLVITNSADMLLWNAKDQAQINGTTRLCGRNLVGDYNKYNRVSGPVHITANSTLKTSGATCALTLDGALTGDSEKKLTIDGAGDITLNGSVNLGGEVTKNGSGTMWLNGAADIASTVWCSAGTLAMTSTATRTIYVNTYGTGTVLLGDGTLRFKRLRVTNGSSASSSAFRQTGGVLQDIWGDEPIIGDGATHRGFYTIEGGMANFRNTTHIGKNVGALGVFRQTGGDFKVTNDSSASKPLLMIVGEKGRALFIQTGGTNDVRWTGSKDEQDIRTLMGTNGVATMTIAGTGTVFRTGGFKIGVAGGLSTNILNLCNGGTFKANRFRRDENQAAGSFSCINADGGVMMPTFMAGWNMAYDNTEAFFTRNPDKFVLWEKGLVIDTSENIINVTDQTPRETNLGFLFESPTGKGVESVTLPASGDYTSATYYGITPIVFEDSTGWGASAYAEYDYATKKHTKIVITSRGCDYSDSAKAYIESPDRSALYECAISLTSNEGKCGPLVKRGTPPLWLHSANTINGGIVVEEGVLQTRKANVIPANTPVTVEDGATLDLYNKGDITVSTFAGAGAVTNGSVTVTNAVRATCADLFAGKAACFASNLTFADGAVFEITDAENLANYEDARRAVAVKAGGTISRLPPVRLTKSAGTPAAVNGSWSLRLSDDGKMLKFGYDKGVVISIR